MPSVTCRRVLVTLVLALLVGPLAGAATASTLRAQQYGLDLIRAPEVWSTTRGEGTVVAVVDTGVDLRHPDLAPRLLRDGAGRIVGRDFVDGGPPQDEHGHGTQVAGIIAAAALESDTLAGVAPRTRIMPVRALDADGAGRARDIDAAIRWAVDQGADVVNLSLESAVPVPGDVLASGFDDAVRYAWDRGVVVVAASGNSGTPFTDYRASTPVLLVGATDREDRRAAFSDGNRRDLVLAPGVDVVTTSCDPCGERSRSGSAIASGTSFAAPHVAGAVALLRASGRSHQQAVDDLRRTAVEVAGGRGLGGNGHGRIDVAAAFGRSPQATAEPLAPTRRTTTGDPAPADGDARDADDEAARDDAPPAAATRGGSTQEGSRSEVAAPAPPPSDGSAGPPTEGDDRLLLEVEHDDVTDPADPDAQDEAEREDDAAADEVTVVGSSGFRFGLLELFAATVVGMTAVMVSSAIRDNGGLDGPQR